MLREKLIKIGAKVVRHSRKVVFQMAEVAVPRELFRGILEGIGRLRLPAAAKQPDEGKVSSHGAEKRWKSATGDKSAPVPVKNRWNTGKKTC